MDGGMTEKEFGIVSSQKKTKFARAVLVILDKPTRPATARVKQQLPRTVDSLGQTDSYYFYANFFVLIN